MTRAGVSVTGLDRAIAWADSEVFLGDAPSGHQPKVVLSTLGCLIGVGAGRRAILRAAENEMVAATSFDDMVDFSLPAVLRLAARDYARLAIAAGAPIGATAFAVAGFSARAGRVLVAAFGAALDFSPVCPLHRWTSPAIGDPVADGGDVLAVASVQLELLQRDLPAASGGTLIIAELTGARIMTELVDLQTGLRLHRPNLPRGEPTPPAGQLGECPQTTPSAGGAALLRSAAGNNPLSS